MKISDEIEEEIEEIMDSEKLSTLTAVGENIGIYEIEEKYEDEYVNFFKDTFKDTFKGSKFKVAIEQIYEIGKILGGLIKYYAKNSSK